LSSCGALFHGEFFAFGVDMRFRRGGYPEKVSKRRPVTRRSFPERDSFLPKP
jgi:hypothetical protein